VSRAATLVPSLFAGLCDDAAMFPPGDEPAATAIPGHAAHRASWYAPLVGPLLVAAGQIDEVAGALRIEADLGGNPEPPDVVLVVPGGPGTLPSVLDDARHRGLHVVGVEVACDRVGESAEAMRTAVRALQKELPEGVGGVVEVRRDEGMSAALEVLAGNARAGTGYRAKLRTGGLAAEAFPEPAEVARFLRECVALGLPFKCTAGLHHAVRHTNPATGFTHHGFLNILAATHVACEGGDEADIADALEQRSGWALAAVVAELTQDQVAATRAAFTAYGTCSIAEPLDDLAALGLIALPSPHLEQA
jgi:hypothetical protein